MWKLKNNLASIRRAKSTIKPIEYCYQEWIAEPKWIVQMQPKGSEPKQKPYRNAQKKKQRRVKKAS